jgi:CheY-like chemotaxis protein
VSVEDSDTDFMALQFALQSAGITLPVERCSDGQHARRNLLAGDSCPLKQKASLILLDLKLPESDGRELLKDLRARDPNREVPVIVLSTSSHPRDISESYRAGADAYLVKPFELDDWRQQVGAMAGYWLSAAKQTRDPARTSETAVKSKSQRRSPSENRDRLARAIEGEVIPRLLLAHSQDPQAQLAPERAAPQDKVEELARLVLGQDVAAAVAYVNAIRARGTSLEDIFQDVVAPAARLVGDLWKADICTFAEFSEALARLQRMLGEISSSSETMH